MIEKHLSDISSSKAEFDGGKREYQLDLSLRNRMKRIPTRSFGY